MGLVPMTMKVYYNHVEERRRGPGLHSEILIERTVKTERARPPIASYTCWNQWHTGVTEYKRQ